MTRGFYRLLLRLHPPAFRERFGEEMLWIFDQTQGQHIFHLFADCFASVPRQWLLRSSIWKFGAGTLISGLLVLICGYSLQTSLADALRRGNPGYWAEVQRPLAERVSRANREVAPRPAVPSAVDSWPIRPVENSPAITALKKRVESGNDGALTEFWLDATRKGAPLIEPAKDTSNNLIVTFVWRGDKNTENVRVLGPLANFPGLPDLPLKQLPHTDVWYGSWEMRNDFRFTYRFVVNPKPGQNLQQLAVLDPLNPHKMEVAFEGNTIPVTQFSIAAMPHAPPDDWIVRKPGVPSGALESHMLKSTALGGERKIWVYTPPGYGANASNAYPLLVLFDGFSYQHWIPTPTILDNLSHAQKIPAIVAALIDNPPESRHSDLAYNPAFARFLGDELLPWLHKHWSVTRDPRKTIIGGYSMGGAAAAFTALRRPDLFGNVLSQSGSFWEGRENVKWEFVATQYEASPKLPIRFFLEAGRLEDVSKEGPTLLAANRRFVQLLRSKGYTVAYEEVGGTHEPVHWRSTLPDELIAIMQAEPK